MKYPESWGPIDIAEYRIILKVLGFYCWQKKHTARVLKISYRGLNIKLELYDSLGLLPPPDKRK
jgi:hypothetical protein